MTAAESKKRKVLIVSVYLPPTNSIAAVRVVKFAKYLPQFGWGANCADCRHRERPASDPACGGRLRVVSEVVEDGVKVVN